MNNHLTFKGVMNLRKLREIYKKSDDDLLMADYELMPEYRFIIKSILRERGLLKEKGENKMKVNELKDRINTVNECGNNGI